MTSAATADTPDGASALLRVRGLVKRFGPTDALSGVDMTVREREIVGVAGPSGSGKTALLDILAGLHRYDGGTVVFRGYPINLRSRRDAIRIGIAAVSADSPLIPDLTVFENVVLPAAPRAVRQDLAVLRQRVTELLGAFEPVTAGLLDTEAHRLTPLQKRAVRLARALIARAKLYLFDDPFAGLAPREAAVVGTVMTRLRLAGCGVVATSRTLEDLLPLADRVTVLAEGRSVACEPARSEKDVPRLRAAMGETDASTRRRPGRQGPADPVVVASRVAAPPTLRKGSLVASAGEIVALYGADGHGEADLLATIAGQLRRTDGDITLGGTLLPAGDPAAVIRAGGAFAAVDPNPTWADATAGAVMRFQAGRGAGGTAAWPLPALWQTLALPDTVFSEPLHAQPMGVRRRVALAGALLTGTRAVLLDEPTRGLGPGERAAVHAALREAANRGRAVVLRSTDRDEVVDLADRCVILREGCTVASLPRAALDAATLDIMASSPAALARVRTVLNALAREHDGAAFWACGGETHVVCADIVVANDDADPGLVTPGASLLDTTRIAEAMRRSPDPAFITERDGGHATLLVPISTRSGRAHGLIGITVGHSHPLPHAAAVAFRVQTLAETL